MGRGLQYEDHRADGPAGRVLSGPGQASDGDVAAGVMVMVMVLMIVMVTWLQGTVPGTVFVGACHHCVYLAAVMTPMWYC